MTPKQAAYPQLDFNHVASEKDTWWQPDHRETSEEIATRAAEFLTKCFYKKPESCQRRRQQYLIPRLGTVYTSSTCLFPTRRALRTFTIAYRNQTSSISSTPLELPREILGVDTCDERRNISEKRLQYTQLDFNGFESDADPWWTPDHRETDAEIKTRASNFLDLIFYNMWHEVWVLSPTACLVLRFSV
ncbi:hypothetical protein GQ600_9734 [Phytophthora cactorum]|nr:hypothetical protein GQ600_9734 [Phytophthora cactorum]